jgi:hypothetical protein
MDRETISCLSGAQSNLKKRGKVPRREKPDPQDRLVRRIRKVGIPDLLEFRSQLGQLRWIEPQFYACVDTADAIVSERKVKKWIGALVRCEALLGLCKFGVGS